MANQLTKRDQCDIAIIGGGLAGSLAAIHLAKVGLHVVLFERESKTVQKVCGEFLSNECLPLLREVGIDPMVLGGVEITGFRLHGPRHSVETRLPRRAVGLSRAILEEAMLEKACEAGADVRRGVTVEEIIEGLDSPSGSIVIATTEGETRSQRLIVATGKTDFRSTNERVGRDDAYVGFQMHVKLKPSLASKLKKHTDLFVFDQGYGGLSEIDNGLANFSFVMKRDAMKAVGTDWDALTSHIGASCWAASHYLDGAVPQASEFTTLDFIPCGFLRRAPAPAGVFFVGDQMAVLPTLSGDGISVALMTARRAVEAILEEVSGETRLRFAQEASRAYQREMRKLLRKQIDAAFAIHKVFQKPNFVDMSTFAIRAFPLIFNRVFKTTRCRVIAASEGSRLSSRTPGALRTYAASSSSRT